MKNNIKVEDLKEITNSFFDHLKELGFENINIDLGYYWSLSDLALKYNVEINEEEVRREISIGNLFEDWEDLLKIKDNQRSVVSLELMKLGEILTYIGWKVGL